MAKYLYRLGGWIYHHRFKVIGSWFVILLALGVTLASLGSSFDEDMSIPGTKSEKAMDVLNKEFPQGGNGGKIKFIFKAPKGETLDSKEVKAKIQEALKNVPKDKEVAAVTDPYQTNTVNQERKIGYADITYKKEAEKVTEASKHDAEKIATSLRKEGIQTELGGTVVLSKVEVGGISEVVGIIFAYFILAFTFASLLTAGLPIITSVIGLAIGVLCIVVGSNFTAIQSVSLSLAVMIALAVGIDYALFILSRHRQHLAEGLSIKESISRATATAGGAVVFAGVTVVIALCGLSIVNIPFLTAMGLSAGLTVFIVVLAAITLVPAVISVAGTRVSPAKANRFLGKFHSKKGQKESNAWGRMLARYPLPIILICLILGGVLSYPALHIELGLPDNGTKSTDTTERRGYDLMAEGFGEGINGPLVVVLDASTSENAQTAFVKTAEQLQKFKNVAFMTPPMPNQDGMFAIVNILPKTGPNDLETKELVNSIRDKAAQVEKTNNVKMMVTGATAVNIDISDKLADALPKFASVIVAFALLLLIIVFRSILVPLKAVLGFLLTLTATLGFVVLILQDGHFIHLFGIPKEGPILNFMPVLTTGILFGLAMDYEVFLVSRMREDYLHSGDAKKSVLTGLKHSGPVVTAAALIMIAVFASFIFAKDPMIKSMGLALAFGVLFDAFVVRMTLIPALMTLLGRSSWYFPKWLDRIIPNMDIEGEEFLKEEQKKKASKTKNVLQK
ncbi:MMPL family transporter [Priestia koreensis]|uniref:SSD domain-containing protein n=1 Tax=Priestia koreensis TaxID=284581 RepID=A0A0M0L609_9BACI|nr:MMPL family transporter [Priestia koreensis]KOO46459.1 hypothetical protein AMD01_11575 [Priestia koreensis]